jgi:hypothetical protein
MKVENGTQNTGMSQLAQAWSRTSQKFVRSAEKIISQLKRSLSNLSIATRTAKPVHCVRVEKQHYLTDVYCITVPKTEAFCIESGIVVHNCADSARYACMSRPWREKPQTAEVIPIDAWGRRKHVNKSWKTM